MLTYVVAVIAHTYVYRMLVCGICRRRRRRRIYVFVLLLTMVIERQ